MTNIEHENKRLLDVVNEKDEIVGAESRNRVHELGLLHREIHVWIFDEDKNIFFQKRGLHRPSAGALDASVGGHVNKGESYLETALRETKEETGLSIKPSDLIELEKFQKLHTGPRSRLGGTVNNFFRVVYIYKQPVSQSSIKKESGIPRGGFQKLPLEFLLNLNYSSEKELEMFDKSILPEELSSVLDFLKNNEASV